jgi:hypothetical protein
MSDNPSPTGLAEEVATFLGRRMGRRLRELRVIIQEGAVILRGQVSTYYDKQRAQHVIMDEIKLQVLANKIEVG